MTDLPVGSADDLVSCTLLCVTAQTDLAFGAPAFAGSGERTAVAEGETLLGVVCRDLMSDPDGTPGYEAGQAAYVLTTGVAGAQASVAVTQGDPVHVEAGVWTAGPGGQALAGATWDKTTLGPDPSRILIQTEA